jgi:hypothetical protein
LKVEIHSMINTALNFTIFVLRVRSQLSGILTNSSINIATY